MIHGGIDGYSRMIVFLKANPNNTAATVFDVFVRAVERFGLPSRVRTDKGGENVDLHDICCHTLFVVLIVEVI